MSSSVGVTRRTFCRTLAGAGIASLGLTRVPRIHAAPAEYTGKLLVVLQLDGGWDVTSLCDPKTNQRGEPEINHWARSADIETAGNIAFAPFAANRELFGRHHRKMLVINGVDAQTNSHTTGVLHNWSGRNAAGLPTLSALFAARHSPDAPLAYLNFGGFADTARLIRYSRLDDHAALLQLLNPVSTHGGAEQFRSDGEVARVHRYQRAALERRLASDTLTPRQHENLTAYLNARSTRDALHRLQSILPPEDQFLEDTTLPGLPWPSNLLRQIQLTLLTFKAGVGSASDLFFSGFDTHAQHDGQHESLFNHLAQAVDYFWSYAGELGIAERILLVMGSDFGRTPHYNADNGKDHWPIGSYVLMEASPDWGNRVVGLTDGAHNALKIHPTTLSRDDRNGTLIYPKHVHQALRRYLDVEEFALARQLGFGLTEHIDFFNPARST